MGAAVDRRPWRIGQIEKGIVAPRMRTRETQILPFADHRALKLYGQFEGAVYHLAPHELSITHNAPGHELRGLD